MMTRMKHTAHRTPSGGEVSSKKARTESDTAPMGHELHSVERHILLKGIPLDDLRTFPAIVQTCLRNYCIKVSPETFNCDAESADLELSTERWGTKNRPIDLVDPCARSTLECGSLCRLEPPIEWKFAEIVDTQCPLCDSDITKGHKVLLKKLGLKFISDPIDKKANRSSYLNAMKVHVNKTKCGGFWEQMASAGAGTKKPPRSSICTLDVTVVSHVFFILRKSVSQHPLYHDCRGSDCIEKFGREYVMTTVKKRFRHAKNKLTKTVRSETEHLYAKREESKQRSSKLVLKGFYNGKKDAEVLPDFFSDSRKVLELYEKALEDAIKSNKLATKLKNITVQRFMNDLNCAMSEEKKLCTFLLNYAQVDMASILSTCEAIQKKWETKP